jgi:hypothetical protein
MQSYFRILGSEALPLFQCASLVYSQKVHVRLDFAATNCVTLSQRVDSAVIKAL